MLLGIGVALVAAVSTAAPVSNAAPVAAAKEPAANAAAANKAASKSAASDAPQKIAIADLRRPLPVNFESEVLPLLAKNCLACHKSDGAENNLVLESPETIRKGGDSGPAVIPGQSAKSLLLQLASHEHRPIMPPVDNKVGAAPLSPEQLGLVKLWIDQGAQGSAGTIVRVIERHPPPSGIRPILALAITPDNDYAACSRGNQLDIYNLRGPRMIAELVDPQLAAAGFPGAAHEDLIRSLAFSPQGDLLASGGFRTIKFWRRPRGSFEREIAGTQAAHALAVAANGSLAAVGSESGTIELEDLGGKQPPKALADKLDSAVNALAFSPDGSRLYSAGSDRTLRVWDVAAGNQLAKITTPAEPRALALLNGGEQLATGDADNVVRIWNVADLLKPPTSGAKAARELKGHSNPITALAILGVGKTERLLSASEDRHVRIWNPANGNIVRELEFDGPVASVAGSSDGRRVFAVGTKGFGRLWNPDNGGLLAEMKDDPVAAPDIARAKGAAAYANDAIEYRREEMREAEGTMKRESTALEDAKKAKIDDEKAVVEKTAPAEKAIAARNAAEKLAAAALADFKADQDKLTAARATLDAANKSLGEKRKAFDQAKQAAEKDKNDKDLAAARQTAEQALADATAAKPKAEAALADTKKSYQMAEDKNERAKRSVNDASDQARQPERELQEAKSKLQGRINFIATATIVADRAKAAMPVAQQAVAAAEARAKQCDAEKKKLLDAAQLQKPLRAVAFSPDNRFAAVAGDSSGVRLYDAVHGAVVEVLQPASGTVENVSALAFDGNKLLALAGKRLLVWQLPGQWKLERTIGRADDPSQLVDRVLSLDFSPDGKLLAAGGGLAARSGQLQLWNVADGKLLREIPGAHRDTIFCVRFSPDGQYLATGSADRLLKVFRVADGSLVRTFEGHTSHVLGVAWQPDGKVLATCGADRVVKLWNFETGAGLRTIRGDAYQIGDYKGEVTSISFIGNTELLLACGGDHTVRVHRTTSDRDVRAFNQGQSFMHAAAATSDGHMILAGGRDGVLHIWTGDGAPIPLLEPTGNPSRIGATAAK